MLRIPLPEYADGTLTTYMVFTNRTRETQTFAGTDPQKYRCAWNKVIFVDLCPRKYVNPCGACGLILCSASAKAASRGTKCHCVRDERSLQDLRS